MSNNKNMLRDSRSADKLAGKDSHSQLPMITHMIDHHNQARQSRFNNGNNDDSSSKSDQSHQVDSVYDDSFQNYNQSSMPGSQFYLLGENKQPTNYNKNMLQLTGFMGQGATELRGTIGISAGSMTPRTKMASQDATINRNHWVPDNKARQCFKCYKEFTFFNRKHHCRVCGSVFCNTCTVQKSISYAQKNVRICTACEKVLEDYHKSLLSKTNLIKPKTKDSNFNADESDILSKISFEKEGTHNEVNYNSASGGGGPGSRSKSPYETAENGSQTVRNAQLKSSPNLFGRPQPPRSEKKMLSSNNVIAKVSNIEDARTLQNFEKVKEKINLNEKVSPDDQEGFSRYIKTIKNEDFLSRKNSQNLDPEDKPIWKKLKDYSASHIHSIVVDLMKTHQIDMDKWQEKLINFVSQAVDSVKPSSRMLNDSMNINQFIKIKIINFADNSRSSFINGIVLSKNLADRRMESLITNPKILLLKDSLGFIKDEGDFMDIANVIDQEDCYVNILKQKLRQVNPNLIIVEKDVSFKVLDTLREIGITVVTNMSIHKMKRIARYTQTIITPSTNVIEKTFVLGKCKQFYIQKVYQGAENPLDRLRAHLSIIEQQQQQYHSHHNQQQYHQMMIGNSSGIQQQQKMQQNAIVQQRMNVISKERNLMYFDGCNPALGCTIVLSGNFNTEVDEMKRVKTALREMLKLARNVILERAFLFQIQCNIPRLLIDCGSNQGNVMDTPFLITRNVNNRQTIVFSKVLMKKGVVSLAEMGNMIPNNIILNNQQNQQTAAALGVNNIHDLDEAQQMQLLQMLSPQNQQTMPPGLAHILTKVNENYVKTKIDSMCGCPSKEKMTFYKDNDETLGSMLKKLCRKATTPCEYCKEPMFKHFLQYYHKDGCIEIQLQLNSQDSSLGKKSQGPTPVQTRANKDVKAQQKPNQDIMIQGYCNICQKMVAPECVISSYLYEYSTARFLEQYFYNGDKLLSRNTSCGHRALRDVTRIFIINGGYKISFHFHQLDVYNIEMIQPKKADIKEYTKKQIEAGKENIEKSVVCAYEDIKKRIQNTLAFIKEEKRKILTKEYQQELQQTNVTIFLSMLRVVKQRLHITENEMKEIIATVREPINDLNSVFEVLYMERKMLVCFMTFSKLLDEVLKVACLLLAIIRRRVFVLSQPDAIANSVVGISHSEQPSIHEDQPTLSRKLLSHASQEYGAAASTMNAIAQPNSVNLAAVATGTGAMTNTPGTGNVTPHHNSEQNVAIHVPANNNIVEKQQHAVEQQNTHKATIERASMIFKLASKGGFQSHQHQQQHQQEKLQQQQQQINSTQPQSDTLVNDTQAASNHYMDTLDVHPQPLHTPQPQNTQALPAHYLLLTELFQDMLINQHQQQQQQFAHLQTPNHGIQLSGKLGTIQTQTSQNYQTCVALLTFEVNKMLDDIKEKIQAQQEFVIERDMGIDFAHDNERDDDVFFISRENSFHPTVRNTTQFMTSMNNNSVNQTVNNEDNYDGLRVRDGIKELLSLNWVKLLQKGYYPTLPLGSDNQYVPLKEDDTGSYLAFILSSNIYKEALIKQNYMDLAQKIKSLGKHTSRQAAAAQQAVKDFGMTDGATTPKVSRDTINNQVFSHQAFAQQAFQAVQSATEGPIKLFGKNDVFNSELTSHQIETELLCGERLIFEVKFSTHKKDLSLKMIKNGVSTKLTGTNFAFTTGIGKGQRRTTGLPDFKSQSTLRQQNELNDLQLKVLPNLPKDYMEHKFFRDGLCDLDLIVSNLRGYYTLGNTQYLSASRTVSPGRINTGPINLNNDDLSDISDQEEEEFKEQPSFNILLNDAHTQSNPATRETQTLIGAHLMPKTPNLDVGSHLVHNSLNNFPGTLQSNINVLNNPTQGFSNNAGESNQFCGVNLPSLLMNERPNKALGKELGIQRIDFELKMYYPKKFEALRRYYCGSQNDFIQSMMWTIDWTTVTGGKTKSKFFRSHDEKYVFKEVKKSEFKMFLEFAPTYFDYLCKSFFHNYPCTLCKILGAYKVKTKYFNPSKLVKRYIYVMENMNFGIKPEDEGHIVRYDLKGSNLNRFVQNKEFEKVVLHDNNFLWETMGRPLPIRYNMNRILHICINNDTLCLSKSNIVDYSLITIIDTKRKKIRFGIIDYVQQYTIDKIFESKFKGVISGGEIPTIVDPEKYKLRFKKAMRRYFVGMCIQEERISSKSKDALCGKNLKVVPQEDEDSLENEDYETETVKNEGITRQGGGNTAEHNNSVIQINNTSIIGGSLLGATGANSTRHIDHQMPLVEKESSMNLTQKDAMLIQEHGD